MRAVRPFRVQSTRVGYVKHPFADTLARWPAVFRVTPTEVTLSHDLEQASPAARSRAVDEVLRTLQEEDVIKGWRDEAYVVNRTWGESPLLLIERAAVPFFGVCGYGVHMNGYVRIDEEIHMWVARRSLSKPTGPGKLDQIVAGGQPAGIGLKENMIKECGEEAAIPPNLAQHAVPVGAVSYCLETEAGMRPDVIFNYDLELPRDFEPVNTDGEVDSFFLWPMERVIETVRDTEAYKFNCALVVIDFLIRNGFIPPEHPDYMDIVNGLLARGHDAM